MMTTYVLSIHDARSDGRSMAFDLRDVLCALGDIPKDYRFVLKELDATGPRADEIAERLASAAPLGLLVSADELVEIAAGLDQTIDAEIVGYPKTIDPSALTASDRDLAAFPTNCMALAILAIDSSYFEVYTKNVDIIEALERTFRSTRREDPESYFS